MFSHEACFTVSSVSYRTVMLILTLQLIKHSAVTMVTYLFSSRYMSSVICLWYTIYYHLQSSLHSNFIRQQYLASNSPAFEAAQLYFVI